MSGPVSSLLVGLVVWTTGMALPGSEVIISPTGRWPIQPTTVPHLATTGGTMTLSNGFSLVDGGILTLWKRVVALQSLDGWGGVLGWVVTVAAAGLHHLGAWFTCFGVCCIGHGLLNLAPILPLNGGLILWLTFEQVVGRRLERLGQVLTITGAVLMLAFFCRIEYADVIWLYHWLIPQGPGR